MSLWPFKKKSDPFDEVLKAHIDGDFSVFACGKDAPSQSTFEAFEKSVGFRLPDDFKRLSLSGLGGVYIEANESVWPRPKEFHVGPFWSFLYGLHVYGLGKDIPEFMDIRAGTETFRAESQTNYVPCLRVLTNADLFCFDENGRVRQWDHETGDTPIVEGTFTELFTREVAELRKRKDRKKAGEDRQGISPPPLP